MTENKGRALLQRELERSALRLMRERDAATAITADFDKRRDELNQEHLKGVTAVKKQQSKAEADQADLIAEVKKRFDILTEALRLVDEEGCDPIIARMTAELPEPPAPPQPSSGWTLASLANGMYRSGYGDPVALSSSSSNKAVPHLHTGHQRRMANRNAVRR